MNYAAIWHRPSSEYAFALDDTHYVFRLRAQAGDLTCCALWYADRAAMGPLCYRRAPMEKRYTDALADWFELRLTTQLNRIAYYFELCDGARTAYYIGGPVSAHAAGGPLGRVSVRLQSPLRPPGRCRIGPRTRWSTTSSPTASQAARAVWRGNPKVPPSAAKPAARCWAARSAASAKIWTPSNVWDATASTSTPSLPPAAITSMTRWTTSVWTPASAPAEDLRQLVHAAHARGMRVILDGVFNHVSSRHSFFQDVLAQGRQSRYYRWFYDLPEHPRLPAEGELPEYACFSYVADMPKTDLSCPEACAYFCEVGRYWIETFDIDGWRLDVANEINDGFLRAFRAAVKAAKPDALLIGEVWEDASHFLQGDMLDSCMNYDFRRLALQFFARRTLDAGGLAVGLHWLLTRYREPAMLAQLNLLDSHDVSRFLTECGGGRGAHAAGRGVSDDFSGHALRVLRGRAGPDRRLRAGVPPGHAVGQGSSLPRAVPGADRPAARASGATPGPLPRGSGAGRSAGLYP